MSMRPRWSHRLVFKAMVALAAARGEKTPVGLAKSLILFIRPAGRE
jgi:hypothetical protein